jgi:hypothetical protein
VQIFERGSYPLDANYIGGAKPACARLCKRGIVPLFLFRCGFAALGPLWLSDHKSMKDTDSMPDLLTSS